MPRSAPPPPDRRPGVPGRDLREEAPATVGDDAADAIADATSPSDGVDLSSLSVAGITRRRVAWVTGALVSAWIVIVFARQVGDAAAASSRAVQLAEDNAALAAEVQSLQAEVDLTVRPEYVAIAARGVGLGQPHEISFALGDSVAPPIDGAPGSASVRLGARAERQTPLESWLSLLFGPGN